MRKVNHQESIFVLLKELKTSFPHYSIGRHISTAVDDDMWGLSDKELLFLLEKYKLQLEMDVEHNDKEIDDIIKEGMDLDNILKEDDNEY